MKVCLIFSPFSSFSYVPLGISYLKSFIPKNMPSVCVRNLDFSNNFYHNLDKQDFSSCLSHLCQACPRNNKPKCKGILRNKEFNHWIKATLVFKSCITDLKTNAFYNANKYNKLRKMYDLFYDQIILCINRILKYSLELMSEENDIILENNLFKDDINKIISENPDIVGFSIFSEQQLYYSLALAKILKAKINPQIIFGGAYIPHLDKKAILEIFDFIDFIIYKEGELGIVSLLKNFKKRRFFNEVPNLVYRKNGRVIENKESVIHNLDEIPFPDFSDYKLSGYFTPHPVLQTLFSRGCFWGRCTFCALRKSYSKPNRVRSIPNLILELEYYQKKGIKHIWFADENILATDLDLISKALSKGKIKIAYGVMARPTGDFTYEILQRMYRVGFRNIVWGVESANQRILNLLNKGTRVEEIESLLKTSSKVGLSNTVYMIQGFPTQTKNEFLKDVEFLKKKSKYIYNYFVHPFWLENDTVIFKNPKKFGLKYLKKNYLLKTKRGNLFSENFSFITKKKIDWRRLNKLLKKKQFKEFNDTGLFHTREHSLLHLAR